MICNDITEDADCLNATTTVPAKSYQVSLIEIKHLTDAPPKHAIGLTSGCQKLSSCRSSFNLLKLPFGNEATTKLFGMEIRFFRDNEDCNPENDLTETFYFHGGICLVYSQICDARIYVDLAQKSS
jgi:hypothetical protein